MKERRKTTQDETIAAHLKSLKPAQVAAPVTADVKGSVRKIMTQQKCHVPENW